MVQYEKLIKKYGSTTILRVLGAIALLLLGITSFLLIRCSMQSARITKKVGHELLQKTHTTKQAILAFVDEQRTKLQEFGNEQDLITLADALRAGYKPGAIGDYENTTPAYKEVEKKLDQFLSQKNSMYQFKDIMLIDVSGKVYYTFKNDLINVDLVSTRSRSTNLAESFERARMTLTTDVSEFSVDTDLNAPALYLMRPLFSNGKLIAFVAIQADEGILYKIIQNYEGLGQTGDIFVTKNTGGRVIFVAPSRLYSNVAFKKITDPSKEENTPTRLATSGKTGFGYLVDAYNVPVIAAWTFVPQVNLGLSVGIQYAEAAAGLWWQNLFCWLFALLLVLYGIFCAYFFGHLKFLRPLRNTLFSIGFLKRALSSAALFCLLVSGFLFWHGSYYYQQIVKQTISLAQAKVNTEVETIGQNIVEIEKIASMIGDDLQSGALKKEDILIRLTKDVKEVPAIENISLAFEPFVYDPQKRLVGFEAKKIAGVPQGIPIEYDYMAKGQSQLIESDWYNRTMKEGAGWSKPQYDGQGTKVIYSLPFYMPEIQKPAGVIALTYNLDNIVKSIKDLEIGKMGYGTLIAADGSLIYHPLEQYVEDKLTLADLAQESNNQALKQAAQSILSSERGVERYTDQIKIAYWNVYQKIPHVDWRVIATFSSESLALPLAKLRKELIWAIVFLVLGLLLLAMRVTKIWDGIIGIKRWAIVSTLILAATLVAFWNFTRIAPYEHTSEFIVVRDRSGLDKYLELLDVEARQRNEKRPIAVPTGIILYNVNFPGSNKVSISGYLWQKIPKDSGITPGVLFPASSESTFKEIFRKQDNDTETFGWNITATFLQKHRYSFFPFDKVHVDIILASADFENNVILTPDFTGYKSYDVDPLPGITNKIDIPGYYLDRSFFSFSVIPAYDEVGLDALRNVTEKVRLHYNIILKRKLINPLIIFMLPLLIILFSIYAVFLVTQRWRGRFDAFRSLGAYTGLFFSLVILHQTLRNQVQSGELLYIEYFFFFTYITILLLVFHTLLLRVSTRAHMISEKISPFFKIIFWPLQFILWFGITMIIFYSVR